MTVDLTYAIHLLGWVFGIWGVTFGGLFVVEMFKRHTGLKLWVGVTIGTLLLFLGASTLEYIT